MSDNSWWSGGTERPSQGYYDAMRRYYQEKYPEPRRPQAARVIPGAGGGGAPQPQMSPFDLWHQAASQPGGTSLRPQDFFTPELFPNQFPPEMRPSGQTPQPPQMRPGAGGGGTPQPQMPMTPNMPQGPFGNAGRFGGMYQNPQMSPTGGRGMLPNMMGAFFGGGGLRGGGGY